MLGRGQDIGPRYAGVLLGMSNTAGVLAGVLGTGATGLILSNGGTWSTVRPNPLLELKRGLGGAVPPCLTRQATMKPQ